MDQWTECGVVTPVPQDDERSEQQLLAALVGAQAAAQDDELGEPPAAAVPAAAPPQRPVPHYGADGGPLGNFIDRMVQLDPFDGKDSSFQDWKFKFISVMELARL